MREYVSFDLDDGSPIVAEIDESGHERGVSRASRRTDDLVMDSGKKFDEMLDVVRPVANKIVGRLREAADAPNEIVVEFGLKLTVSAGAVIAASSGEANFRVSLSWKRDSEGGT